MKNKLDWKKGLGIFACTTTAIAITATLINKRKEARAAHSERLKIPGEIPSN